MTELSAYAFSALREGEFTLYRGLGDGLAPILLVAPAGEYPPVASLQRLEHEYALKAELDAAWAARPVALCRQNDRMTLVLEDPGGEPLERLLGRPLEVAPFLRIAAALAATLRRVHARGLIHKDLKPANILVDAASGSVWLTGFGIASLVPREHRALEPPEVIAGTLAYMAPEQTGRMNRSIDSRSDLYSLGITLYEMLTGTLPFAASDPIEWIHCHVARQPTPPSERVRGIPPPLAAIVMKLLAKTAEDRYQTAAGLEADLRTCLTAWEASGRIDAFPLAARDASDHLLIPEKLYGREGEIDALVAAFDRVVTHGTSELVLVSGYAGIGKSSIVSELHKVLVPLHGLFAVGKFDQYKREIPYATLAQAFQGLVRQLLSKNDAELGRWRSALMEALGPNGKLMVNMIPELSLVIGEQPDVPEAPPRDAQNRFQLVFRQFLDVFARPEHPLVLFLDDLQWLDAGTLELVRHLVVAPEVRHLLIVGAYRDNEVGPSHPLTRTLRTVAGAGGKVQEIELAALTLDDVARLVADALRAERDHLRPLAELVFEKTGGNPFFVTQFVTALAEGGLLTFDPDAAAWRWDLDRIRAKRITDNVVELMAGKVSRLPYPALRVLKQLACLGTVAQAATLSMVLGTSEGEIHAALGEVVRSGLVFLRDGAYAFVHDRVREAVYALIPEAERAAIHLRIGRSLASQRAPAEFEDTIFEIVHQLERGAALIDSPTERDQVAALNLTAGKRAKASTAYASALTYFTAGRMLLGPNGWLRNRKMSFDFEIHSAECEFLTGELVAAEQRLSALSEHTASLVDRAAVTRLRLALYTTLDRSDRAIEVGLGYLRDAGIEWSRHPTDEDVRNEYERTRRLLAGRPLEQVLVSPLMSDMNWRATMDVLTDLMPPLLFTTDNLHDLALLRMANISLEHGNCDASCYAYARLMRVLGTQFSDYQTAFRFGQLACDLVRQRGLDRFKARVYMCFGIYVSCWFQHLATSRVWITRSLDAANASGDLTYAMYASKHLATNLLVSGEPLRDVEREIERGLAIARKAKFGLVIDAFVGQLMMIRSLRGQPPDAVTPDDEGHGEGWFERHLAQPHLALPACWYWIHKLQTCFFARDHVAGLAAAAMAARFLWSSRAYLELAEYHLYAALVLAAACDAAPADIRHRHLEALYDHYRQIMVWAESCPANFENCAALVGAEIARLQGRELDAQRLYERAIHSAREHGFIQNEGVSYELAGRFYAARGFETIANAYLHNARNCYDRWGALGKVKQLDELYPHLQEERAHPAATIGTPVGQLDVETVVKASQALSGEIVLENLIKTLMVIAVEHAGAERGLLVLPRGDQLWVEAEATTGLNTVEVNLRQALVTSSELPGSVLQYVIRTQEPVILDDASKEELFSADSYILQRRARSVLCLPLIKQTKLVGVLYIENNLAASVFTPARIAVLKLLSSQAAISLENARLYAALRRSEASLTEAQQISHTGSWRLKVGTGELSWSAEYFRIFAFDPATTRPSRATLMERIHAEDGPSLEQAIQRAVRERSRFQYEYRIVLPDGSIKHLQSVGQPDITETGDLEYVGTVMDITERRHAEEALRDTQAELARVARLTTMGELVASIAHEINQPLAGVVTNANAGLRWLNRDEPELDEARNALSRVVSDGTRASEVIRALRALAKKTGPHLTKLDINDAIHEVLALTRSELRRHGVVLHTELSAGDRPVFGDRVQLQQVLLNLIMNGVEAMSAVTHCPKMLAITSEAVEPGEVLVAVEDTGTGLDPATADRIFEPFFTTKSDGMGMGLSICRSIIEAHGGRFWASPGTLSGTVFRFTVPGAPSS